MIIGIDLTWLEVLNRSGGAFNYAVRLTNALVNYTDESVVAITNPQLMNFFTDLQGKTNFKLVRCDSELHFNGIIAEERIDIIHAPRQDYTNVTLSVPMVNSLHDLQQYHFPNFFSDDALAYRDKYYRGSSEFSERIIVSYQHVKDDVIKYYGISSDKIDVCPVGMVEAVIIKNEAFEDIKNKYKLPCRYLLYPAATWRHKNHIGLFKALKIVREQYGIDIVLVCTGYQYQDYFPLLEQAVKDLQLDDSVLFLGYLPDSEIHVLVANASLIVIPTLYEAGSYPLLEAMAYGAPVICSNVTSLPDSIGDHRFIFDPTNNEDMAYKIAIMLSSSQLIEDNKRNSIKRTNINRWDSIIRYYIASYERAIASFNNNRRKVLVDKCIATYEMQINQCRLQLVEATNEKNALEQQLQKINDSQNSLPLTSKFIQVVKKLLK